MLAAGTSGNGGVRESNDDDDPEAASPFLISVGIGDGNGKVGFFNS